LNLNSIKIIAVKAATLCQISTKMNFRLY